MKKKIWIPILVVVVVLILPFVPLAFQHFDDGGTRAYTSLSYKIVDWNRTYDSGVFDETRVYWGRDAYKTLDELWEEESATLEHRMIATIGRIMEGYFELIPVKGDPAARSSDLFVVSEDKRPQGGYGTVVEVTYVGGIMESYPAQINVTSIQKVEEQRDRAYEGEWLPKEGTEKREVPSFTMLRITQIYSDCFFAEPRTSEHNFGIKVNGKLSDDFCVGDDVYGTFQNFSINESAYRAEMDCVKLYIDYDVADKPVIYLYPEEELQVSVKVTPNGELTCTYPAYKDGWTVIASPDGTLTDENGKTYNYLYWEGKCQAEYDFSRGFCVRGEDTALFLEDALEQLGLTRREANEFIVYWLPLMQENEYNVIAFQTDAYTESAPLIVDPAPDTLIRVFMAWYGSEDLVELPEQELTAPEREGFTVVEWGGSHIKR